MPKATPARPEPLRRRVSIPHVDTSTQQWWDCQDDPSTSIRLLIREEIERNGYVDKMNHPVQQQPRRGRPPGRANSTAEEFDERDAADDSDAAREREASIAAASNQKQASAPAQPKAQPAPQPDPPAPRSDDDASALDDLMNN